MKKEVGADTTSSHPTALTKPTSVIPTVEQRDRRIWVFDKYNWFSQFWSLSYLWTSFLHKLTFVLITLTRWDWFSASCSQKHTNWCSLFLFYVCLSFTNEEIKNQRGYIRYRVSQIPILRPESNCRSSCRDGFQHGLGSRLTTTLQLKFTVVGSFKVEFT